MSLAASDIDRAESINFSPGGVATLPQGAFTVAVLFKPEKHNTLVFQAVDAGGTQRRATFLDAFHLYHFGDFSTGFSTLTQSDWYWVVQTKVPGSAVVRWHVGHLVDADTITWTHGTSAGASNAVDYPGNTVDFLSVGGEQVMGPRFKGEFAAVAAWTSSLSDAVIESSLTFLAQDAADAGAGFLVLAPEATAADPLTDALGGSGELTRSLGWTPSADPAGFDFAVTVDTSDTTPPSTPTGLAAASITQTAFDLTWTASTDDVAVTGYQYTLDGGTTVVNADSGVTISGLTADTDYSVQVRARDAAGNFSAWSTALPVSTLAAPPAGGGTVGFRVRLADEWVSIV